MLAPDPEDRKGENEETAYALVFSREESLLQRSLLDGVPGREGRDIEGQMDDPEQPR